MNPTLEEAVECMIEGTNATGFCAGSWGRSDNLKIERLDFDPNEMYDNMDLVDRTCAEGALIYGAWLRGHDQEYAFDLVCALERRYGDVYERSINGDNDTMSISREDDVRHEIIGKAKELL